MAFRVGDSVKMKNGIKDSEYGKWDLSGWQGWITQKPSKDDPLYELVWDTETLKNMPNDFIVAGNIDEVDWVFYATGDDELESAIPRDTFESAKIFAAVWDQKHAFNDGSEEGIIIMKVIGDEQNVATNLAKWHRYLSETLKFPFEVTVIDSDNKAVKEGHKVTVTGFSAKAIDEDDGLIVKVKARDVGVPHPLCDLEGLESASNTVHLNAYTGWFVCQ